jgi:hypothetical protein
MFSVAGEAGAKGERKVVGSGEKGIILGIN